MKVFLAGVVLGLAAGLLLTELSHGPAMSDPPPPPGPPQRIAAISPREGPPAPPVEPPEDTGPPEASWPLDRLVAETDRTLRAGGSVDRLAECLLSHSRRWRVDLPSDLVIRILEVPEHGDEALALLPFTTADATERALDLARTHPFWGFRKYVLSNATLAALRHPGLRERLIAALVEGLGDPCRWVREEALACLGPMLPERPALTPAVLDLARRTGPLQIPAICQLEFAGEAGAVLALDLLRGGDYPPDALPALARSVVTGERVCDALTGKTPPDVLTALILAAEGDEDADRREANARSLRGGFEKNLPRFEAREISDYGRLFDLACLAGDFEFVRSAALSSSLRVPVRKMCWFALGDAAAESPDARRLCEEVGENVLFRRVSGTRERFGFLEVLACVFDVAEDEGWRSLVRSLVGRVADSDPSEHIRRRAEEMLEQMDVRDE